jgi:hypothetical protein
LREKEMKVLEEPTPLPLHFTPCFICWEETMQLPWVYIGHRKGIIDSWTSRAISNHRGAHILPHLLFPVATALSLLHKEFGLWATPRGATCGASNLKFDAEYMLHHSLPSQHPAKHGFC